MAILYISPTHQSAAQTVEDPPMIQQLLAAKGVVFAQWQASIPLDIDASQDDILNAYAHATGPLMAANGYQTADVINVHPETPRLDELRAKFLKEHTHSEDEVRFFVDGQGTFWFNFDDGSTPVIGIRCQAGDLLSVPAGFKHWFDIGEPAFVKVIRIFTDPAGWVPHYTGSDIEAQYVFPESSSPMATL